MSQVQAFTLARVETASEVSVVPQVQAGSEVEAVPQAQTNSEVSAFRRAIDWWPYVFIVVSVTGLAYIALTSSR
jgi:hypothetical protein